MIELLIGVAVGLAFGSSHGWPPDAGIAAGVALGAVIYFASCAVWPFRPCWWPWCPKRRQTKKGPGKSYRRRQPCPVCKNADYLRLGARYRK